MKSLGTFPRVRVRPEMERTSTLQGKGQVRGAGGGLPSPPSEGGTMQPFGSSFKEEITPSPAPNSYVYRMRLGSAWDVYEECMRCEYFLSGI